MTPCVVLFKNCFFEKLENILENLNVLKAPCTDEASLVVKSGTFSLFVMFSTAIVVQ